MSKSTNVEYNRRVNDVYKLLLSGVSRADLIEYATKKWDIKPPTVDLYIAEARKRFEARAEVERQAEFGKALERLEMLFKSTLSDKDYKTALQVQKELSILLGLNAPKKLEHSGSLELTWEGLLGRSNATGTDDTPSE